ncbi:glyoxylase-like metal-dependent hydrolase (beta-lactamase superfamily II) [Paenibacillus sp. PvR052]|nr:glyoxylase-like metal-dependent hydrolase (beta-lactamase superfamily II) [Paenibacillus sp. PvP091]MBP1170296.1 glyoxylase-like metal-dependent hydrolase (beta-lactamase superfamily II) [Paenibacillus sp. PvR098]MBP2441324.1 glyoxylase-like metal-dependent hydrolase (beta-lactamase superfamily II) [Paenibacillus sp. PvP052]
MEKPFEHTMIPVTTVTSGSGQVVKPDIYCLPIQIVNVLFVGEPQTKEWVLVDAGMPRSADDIIGAAEERFGRDIPPKAIILTHGHFDHVGAIVELIERWKVPVYAHEMEIPYLTGKANYPPGDPTVDGGLISEMSPLFPNHGIDLGSHVKPLSPDGSVDEMPDWKWIHTPGHTPGHISLFREKDRSLIAGDAFVCVKQESLFKVVMQELEISGPPKYFTTDWHAAWESVKKLEALQPSAAVTGHGLPMSGELLTQELDKLAREFEHIAIPEHGRYVH